MRTVTLFMFIASFLPCGVLAWSTPGEYFSGELKLEGPVTSTRNPWVWEIGPGNESLEIKQIRSTRAGKRIIPVYLPALTVILGKTMRTTPAGREGLSPRVNYGSGGAGFSLVWTEPGIAEVTLPVTGENNDQVGTFVFRMQAVGVLRHVQNRQPVYAAVYDDLNANGLPREKYIMAASDIPGILQKMFSGEGPGWLQTMSVTTTVALSHFSDTNLRQVEGVYGAQTVAGSGLLRLNDITTERWRGALTVRIEYQ